MSYLSGLPGRVGRALSGLGSRVGSAISSATKSALGAAWSLVSAIAKVFTGLPGAVARAVGDIGGQIASKIKSGLPSGVRNLLPGFANGGMVFGPTQLLAGEAGPEVIIPLTRPQRAAQLAEQSGLTALLDKASGSGGKAAGPQIVNHFTIHEVGDGHATAHRVISRLATAGGWL